MNRTERCQLCPARVVEGQRLFIVAKGEGHHVAGPLCLGCAPGVVRKVSPQATRDDWDLGTVLSPSFIQRHALKRTP